MNQSRRFAFVAAVLVLISAACRSAPEPAPSPSVVQPPSLTIAAGDRIYMYVEGERALSDTFTVRPNGAIDLPMIGSVQVSGVRRTDVQSHLTTQLSRYLKSPVVRANAFVRVGVLGEVARPGFYAVPPEAGVADMLASAGGPTQVAKVESMRVDRDGRVVTSDGEVRRALSKGTSISQLGVTSGDQFVVPRRDPDRSLRTLAVLATIPAAILGIMAISR
jgi:protein involved in polysaccharide export with SLBB domain